MYHPDLRRDARCACDFFFLTQTGIKPGEVIGCTDPHDAGKDMDPPEDQIQPLTESWIDHLLGYLKGAAEPSGQRRCGLPIQNTSEGFPLRFSPKRFHAWHQPSKRCSASAVSGITIWIEQEWHVIVLRIINNPESERNLRIKAFNVQNLEIAFRVED